MVLVCVGVSVLVAGLVRRRSPADPFMTAFATIRNGTPKQQVLAALPKPARVATEFDLHRQPGYVPEAAHYDQEALGSGAREWLVWHLAGDQRACAVGLGPDQTVVHRACRTYKR